MRILIRRLIRFIIGIGSLILKGFVLTKLWSWFIVGTFTDIKLNILVAIGIFIIIDMLTFSTENLVTLIKDAKSESEKDKSTRQWTSTFMHVLIPLLVWLEGWIVTLFM